MEIEKDKKVFWNITISGRDEQVGYGTFDDVKTFAKIIATGGKYFPEFCFSESLNSGDHQESVVYFDIRTMVIDLQQKIHSYLHYRFDLEG